MNSPSPLEQLTAFALCFTFGVVGTVALYVYGRAIKAKDTEPPGSK